MNRLLTISTTLESGEDNLFIYEKGIDSYRAWGAFDVGSRPSYHIVHPTLPILYCVNEKNIPMHGESGSIKAYRVDVKEHVLYELNEVESLGDDPCFLIIDPSAEYLLCANYSGSSITIFKIAGDGSLSEALQRFSWEGHSINEERQEASHPHTICFSPDGSYIYVPDLGCDTLRVFSREKGDLPFKERPDLDVKVTPGSGPRMLSFIPGTNQVWLINELSNTACRYTYIDGVLTLNLEIDLFIRVDRTREGIENTSAHLYCSKDYTIFSNRGLNDLVVFREDGCAAYSGKGSAPRFFLVDESTLQLMVAWQGSDRVDLYTISESGQLSFEKELFHHGEPSCISIANIQ